MHFSLAAWAENAKFSYCQGVFSGASHMRRRMFITLYPHRSYGPDLPGLFKRAAPYVDRILRGEKPGDLTVPQSLVVAANEVID